MSANQKIEFIDVRMRSARMEIEILRRERDEARQWVCQILANPKFVTGLDFPGDGTKYAFAEEQGWDCFKEDE